MDISRRGHRSIGLDIIRIFAAFWVVSFHWTGRGGFSPGLDYSLDLAFWPNWFEAFAAPGFLGVDIFFILSGTVIAASAAGPTWQKFSQNRFLRLFLVYLISSMIAIILVPIADSSWLSVESIASLTGLQFWIGGPTIVGTAWTLAIEVQFYALVALCILILKRLDNEKIRSLSFGLIGLCVVSQTLDFAPISFISISPWGGYFALGALLSLSTDFNKLKRNLFGIVLAMVLSGNNMFNRIDSQYPEETSKYKILISVAVLLLVTLGILFSIYVRKTIIKTPISSKSIATLALMTYPIYLFHEQIGMSFTQIIQPIVHSAQISILISLTSVLLFSWICVKWIEPKMRAALRRLFSWG